MDLSEQTLLTRDNVSLCLDAYVHYKEVLAEREMFEAKDYRLMVYDLRCGEDNCSWHTLGEILGNRKMIEKKIVEIIDGKTGAYGVKVIGIETQKIKLPGVWKGLWGLSRKLANRAKLGK
jgi:regulator of protease activity HflC (stomatin/prohibitin superfamily)